MFSSRTFKEVLSSTYYSEMHSFLQSFKQETADALSHGNVDEKSANPKSVLHFCLIQTCTIEQGGTVVWVWMIIQWNLMARSIPTDPWALHNIAISEDHFTNCHDLTK